MDDASLKARRAGVLMEPFEVLQTIESTSSWAGLIFEILTVFDFSGKSCIEGIVGLVGER